MPEGDTLYRTAATLDRWLAGREITDASVPADRAAAVPTRLLIGQRVTSVESRGKHLLIHLHSGAAVHSHLRMSGSWHVYPAGEKWRRPPSQARLVITCTDRVAVCFNAPVVEVIAPGAGDSFPPLARLGPDLLSSEFDAGEACQRARAGPADRPVGELLLDQRVVAGIGNIWRCEALFLTGHNPWDPLSALADADLDELIATAGRLLQASAHAERYDRRRWVYRRAGRPCHRCRATIRTARQGEQARTAYWCPTCQPPAGSSLLEEQ